MSSKRYAETVIGRFVSMGALVAPLIMQQPETALLTDVLALACESQADYGLLFAMDVDASFSALSITSEGVSPSAIEIA